MSNLTRFDPLDDLFRGFFVRPVDMNTTANTPTIRMDVAEQAKAFVVHAELPGVKKDDIHVQIDGNQVSITAEIKQEKEIKEGDRVLRAERYFGQVSRTFQLAQDIDDSEANAKFADGVLELTLPKKAANSSKRLTID